MWSQQERTRVRLESRYITGNKQLFLQEADSLSSVSASWWPAWWSCAPSSLSSRQLSTSQARRREHPNVSQAETVCYCHLRGNGTERQRYSALLHPRGQRSTAAAAAGSAAAVAAAEKTRSCRWINTSTRAYITGFGTVGAALFQSAQRSAFTGGPGGDARGSSSSRREPACDDERSASKRHQTRERAAHAGVTVS